MHIPEWDNALERLSCHMPGSINRVPVAETMSYTHFHICFVHIALQFAVRSLAACTGRAQPQAQQTRHKLTTHAHFARIMMCEWPALVQWTHYCSASLRHQQNTIVFLQATHSYFVAQRLGIERRWYRKCRCLANNMTSFKP
jgi:hypothetical protein